MQKQKKYTYDVDKQKKIKIFLSKHKQSTIYLNKKLFTDLHELKFLKN